MIRVLYPTPGPVDFGLLATELRTVDSTVIDANDVAGDVAVYTDGTQDEQTIGAVVAAHTGPQQFPPLNETGALATLLVVENVVPLADAANAIHEEPAHLVAEAEAWSLGGA